MAKFSDYFAPDDAKIMMDVLEYHDVKFQLKPADSSNGYIITTENIDIDTAVSIGRTYEQYLRITNQNKKENGRPKTKR